MISSPIQKVIDSTKEIKQKSETKDSAPISVNKITSKAGTFYEKIRYLIDYKEESALRRNAIERILKRKINIEQKEEIGLSLTQELIAAGYLPNEEITESKAKEVQNIINKYLSLKGAIKQEKELSKKIISIASIEVDRTLNPRETDELVVEAFYKTIVNRVKYSDSISEKALQTQVYISCRRALLNDNYDTLFYALFTRYVPDWENIKKPSKAKEVSDEFIKLSKAIEKQLKHPLGVRLASKLKNQSIYFSFIKEIIEEHEEKSEKIFSDENSLKKEVAKRAEEKYENQKKTTKKSGNRSVAYIFITKILIGVGLELPYDVLFLNAINYLALGVNIIFHPLLLLTMVKTAPLPGPENTKKIKGGISKIIKDEDIEPVHVKSQEFGLGLGIMFTIFYLILFGISFGAIIWALNWFHFNIVSMLLFLFFLTLVSYFGWRIRHNAKKWTVEEKEKGFLTLIWNFLTLPIVRTGRWLSRKFASINIFVLIMDFIIETPFKFVLSTFDAFISFLKEREEYFQ